MSFLNKCLGFKIGRKPHQLIAAGNGHGHGHGNQGNDNGDDDDDDDEIRKDCSLRRFTWNEMESFTMNFSQVIGYGGFSTVYLARFPDSTLSAVKIYSSSSERLNRVYQQELDILVRLRHHHIVKLLGFSNDREEGGILVFEYVSNGSLQEKLHGCGRKGSRLPWKNRMAIAFQLAQAIEYLHDKCTLQIVHGDIKASNILLDDKLNCKLCDFGSAKLGFSSMVLPPSSPLSSPYSSMMMMKKQLMMGSPGYTDPNYLRTGIASKKNDVYSFGVVVLELITGMEAFCSERGQMLTSIAGPMIQDDMPDAIRVAEMVDRRLHRDRGFELEEARVMASLTALCLQNPPTLRPSAADILQTMKDKIPSISFLFSPDKKKVR